METKELKTAQVYTDYNGKTRNVNYESTEELMSAIWDLLCEDGNVMDDDTMVTLPDGRRFRWLIVMAHYCFTKGRMTEQEAFEIMMEESVK